MKVSPVFCSASPSDIRASLFEQLLPSASLEQQKQGLQQWSGSVADSFVAKFAALNALLQLSDLHLLCSIWRGPKMIATCRWQLIELLATCNTQANQGQNQSKPKWAKWAAKRADRMLFSISSSRWGEGGGGRRDVIMCPNFYCSLGIQCNGHTHGRMGNAP